jgi:hypothetical protein
VGEEGRRGAVVVAVSAAGVGTVVMTVVVTVGLSVEFVCSCICPFKACLAGSAIKLLDSSPVRPR